MFVIHIIFFSVNLEIFTNTIYLNLFKFTCVYLFMQYLLIRRPQIVTVTVELYQLQFSQNTKLPLTQEPVQGMLSALKDSYYKIKDRINRGLSI